MTNRGSTPLRLPTPAAQLLVVASRCLGAKGCGGSSHAGATGDSGGGGSGGNGADAPADGGYQPPAAGRVDVKLGDGWRFLRADATGAVPPRSTTRSPPGPSVTLPHTWNALDGEDGGASYYRGIGSTSRSTRTSRASC